MRWMLCRPLLLVVLLAVLAGSGLPPASASAPARPLAAGHVMGYGVNAIGAQDAHLSRVQGLGFNWTTGWANWRLLEPSPGDYSRLGDVQIQVDNARARGLRMLVKVRETPDWARPGCGSLTCPPSSTRLSASFLKSDRRRHA